MTETEKPPLTPAATNPWYVLMTVAGEQPHEGYVDGNLHRRNRRYWNGWAAAGLSDAEKARLIEERRISRDEIEPLSPDEAREIRRTLSDRCGIDELPDPENPVSLDETDFPKLLSATGFIFPLITFAKSTFRESAVFGRVYFLRASDFRQSRFSRDAQFDGSTFFGTTIFYSSRIEYRASFIRAIFKNAVDFSGSVFSQESDFSSAEFHHRVDFRDASLSGPATFSGARFTGSATPPLLYEAKLHEDTDWNVAEWPKVPIGPRLARYHLRAYERLKLLMAEQKKQADEHMFLRKELACREVVEESPVLRWGYRLFRLSCDSGWDPVRPAGLLAGVWALGWLLIGGFEYYDAVHLAWPEGCEAAGACPEKAPLGLFQAAALSFSNLFGVLGIGRYFMAEELASLNAASEVVSGAQMIAGPVLLFLMALALRNRFRLA